MLNFEKLQFSFDWLNGTLPWYDVRAFFDKLEDIHPDLAFREFHSRGRGLYNYSESFGLMGDNRFVVAFNPDYDNYETDDYGLGATISFRGYAVTVLSNLHKKDFGITLNHNDEISQDELDYYMNLISITHEKAVKKAKEYFDSSSDIKTLKKNN